MLCPMMDDKAHRLQEGHMFPTKETLWMQIAEEAIPRNIHMQALRSDYSHLKVIGASFFVSGLF